MFMEWAILGLCLVAFAFLLSDYGNRVLNAKLMFIAYMYLSLFTGALYGLNMMLAG